MTVCWAQNWGYWSSAGLCDGHVHWPNYYSASPPPPFEWNGGERGRMLKRRKDTQACLLKWKLVQVCISFLCVCVADFSGLFFRLCGPWRRRLRNVGMQMLKRGWQLCVWKRGCLTCPTYGHTKSNTEVCVRECVCVCACACMHAPVHLSLCRSVGGCICVCLCVCVHVGVCVHKWM